ncbi:Ig-like domain-containing protein, partial [Streptomyces sp. DT225]
MTDVAKKAGTRPVTAPLGRCMLAVLALLAVLTGCSGTGSFIGGKGKQREAIRVVPADRAEDVRADGRVAVEVPDGRLESVRVRRIEDAREQEMPGRIAEDGHSWAPAKGARLGLAAKYSVDAVAVDGGGHRAARHTTFTTAVPKDRFIGYFKPENRSTVGTGMIVSFEFNRPVTRRAAVERAIRVTADPPVAVAGHWFGRSRLDFTVGREQVSRVDAAAHTMEVRRDGELVSTVPVTAGSPTTTTYNGKMVVSEMHEVTRMDGRTVGFGGEYDIKDVPHAIRLTKSGTFLHGNYWSD